MRSPQLPFLRRLRGFLRWRFAPFDLFWLRQSHFSVVERVRAFVTRVGPQSIPGFKHEADVAALAKRTGRQHSPLISFLAGAPEYSRGR